jgi:hypothetical protein
MASNVKTILPSRAKSGARERNRTGSLAIDEAVKKVAKVIPTEVTGYSRAYAVGSLG